MIAIMVAIVVIMSRVFSSIYVGFYGLLSAKLIVILHLAKTFSEKKSPKRLPVSILFYTFAIARILMWSTPHSVEMQKLKYTAVRLPRVFLPFAVDHMRVLADEEVRAAFFVPYRQPYRAVPGIRLELLYYANNCIYPAHSSVAPVGHRQGFDRSLAQRKEQGNDKYVRHGGDPA